MIFDSFMGPVPARWFADEVGERFGLEATVYTDAAKAFEADPIPAQLHAPVVHVERTALRRERQIERLVKAFGGRFVGT